MPEKYVWPNADNLYCKSYCPLHPEVHKIVFDVMDEICDVFETDAFHAGMDEVFYIGDEKCPRCGGRDKAELFAGELTKLSNHLKGKGRELWIWADRLIDGKTTGLGMWEASLNNTHRAVDLIPKEVVLCDWHYERADKTAVYFAMKGFKVITCPWRKPDVAVTQVRDMVNFRQQSTKQMKDRFYGVMQTIWSPVSSFLSGYYRKEGGTTNEPNNQWDCFRAMFAEVEKLSATVKQQ
jgi:N-acetyl-beta-hexosaminidase